MAGARFVRCGEIGSLIMIIGGESGNAESDTGEKRGELDGDDILVLFGIVWYLRLVVLIEGLFGADGFQTRQDSG